MVEIFKNWVSTMLCFGIFITFVQLIVPKTNLKKYIYSLVGIVTILTVVSPVIDLMKNKEVEEGLNEVITSMAEIPDGYDTNLDEYKEANDEALRMGFIEGMKNDIISKLKEKDIEVYDVEIFLTEQYNIEKLEVKIPSLELQNTSFSNVNDVVKYINQQYDLDFSKISVIEEAE